MAIQDWIMVRKDLHEDPAVIRIARLMQVERTEVVVGYLCRFWSWIDGQVIDGKIHGLTLEDVEDTLKLPGFLRHLVNVGWLDYEAEIITIPNWDRWLSKGAKTRMKAAQRKQRERVTKMSQKCHKNVTNDVGQKRQLSSSSFSYSSSSSFSSGCSLDKIFHDRFWPLVPAKKNKATALKAFVKKNEPTEIINAMKMWRNSDAAKCPIRGRIHISTWINQERYKDDPATWWDSAPETGKSRHIKAFEQRQRQRNATTAPSVEPKSRKRITGNMEGVGNDNA